jgi:hypothetical protein
VSNSNHFINWDGLDFKEKESQYEKYHKKPDHFKESFVGPRNTWGGRRKGAGRKPWKKVEEKPSEGLTVQLKLNNIQVMLLKELGNGSFDAGVQALVDKDM